MKKVLIVGQGSYIGTAFAGYAKNRFDIITVEAKNNKWRQVDFSSFDAVLHCAGIAHIKQRDKKLYYSINCDLAVAVAKMAAESGVGQFVFLSSMSVYGKKIGKIAKDEVPKATDYYGGSKLKAEKLLTEFLSEKLCIVRPPMVYGLNCPGNFGRLVKLAKAASFFPYIRNKRSMIYIDNLCEFLCQAIEQNKKGVYVPQNSEHVNTFALVKLINNKIKPISVFNPIIKLLAKCLPSLNKLFSDLYYSITEDDKSYAVVDFETGVALSLKE